MLLIENYNNCVSDVRSFFFTMNFASCRVLRIPVNIALRSRCHQLATKQNCELKTTFCVCNP